MLVSIIAKGLAIVDALLSEWVVVVGTVSTSTGACYNLDVLNVELTACGTEFVAGLGDVVEMLVALLPQIFAGLFAV